MPSKISSVSLRREFVLSFRQYFQHAFVAGLALSVLAVEARAQNGNDASSQNGGGFPASRPVGPPMAQAMSADAIIGLLLQQPMLARAAKVRMAQAVGVDPTTITDQMLFDRIRQDQNLRQQITSALQKRGYATTGGPQSDFDSSMRPGAMPQQGGQAQFPYGTQGAGQGGFQSSGVSPMSGTFPNGGQGTYGGAPMAGAMPYAQQPNYSPQPAYGPQSANGSQPASGSQWPYNGQPLYGAQQPYAPQEPGGAQPINGQPTYGNSQLPSNPQLAGSTGYAGPGQNGLQQPLTQGQPMPYVNLPSLQDLYTQALPPDENLRRFGSDVFMFGSGNSDSLPMDLPAGADYVLGPGDELAINIWGSQPQTLNGLIDRQGQIALPSVGAVRVAGLTIAMGEEAIRKALQAQFKDVHVELSLGRVHTVRVYVVGDVQRPGAYDISSLSTPLNALYAAGGPTSQGSLRVARHYRGDNLVREVDLYDLLLRGIRSDVERLLPGDTILVPPVGPQVTVAGMVRRPAVYELKGTENLKDVVDMAGGVMVAGSLEQVVIERVIANHRRTMLSVRFSAVSTTAKEEHHDAQPTANQGNAPHPPATATPGFHNANTESKAGEPAESLLSIHSPEYEQIMQRLSGMHAEDSDKIKILPIAPYDQQVVYLDGHVYDPGKYPYFDGMTLNDLLKSYQDVLPEPSDHLELIRLQTPDFRPVTINLSLPDVLQGNAPMALEPFDLIRVFGRYEIDPPMVTIQGEVIRPGDYPLEKGITVKGLIDMAGGFMRSAYRESADLASYDVQNGSRVLTKHQSVELDKALQGDNSANIALKPGDVLSIRQLTGWNDIGSSVTINGEVGHPGVYGITEGERLSSVLKRASGFRGSSFPQGAVLERVQVREIGEKSRQNLIQRIQSEDLTSMTVSGSSTPQEQAQMLQTIHQQQQQALSALQNQPASGRLVIHMSEDISKWENTPADIEMREGDVLTIPKRAAFVAVSGQVYSPSALTYSPGRTAGWYLDHAGGPTNMGDKKKVFIVRADGSVIGRRGRFDGSVLSIHLNPGDSVVVPEKIVGSPLWRSLLSIAQMLSATALTATVASGL